MEWLQVQKYKKYKKYISTKSTINESFANINSVGASDTKREAEIKQLWANQFLTNIILPVKKQQQYMLLSICNDDIAITIYGWFGGHAET